MKCPAYLCSSCGLFSCNLWIPKAAPRVMEKNKSHVNSNFGAFNTWNKLPRSQYSITYEETLENRKMRKEI
jgi:hypothetical protein